MATSSKIAVLITALQASLVAAFAATGVNVTAGIPRGNPGDEWVMLGDAIGTQEQAAIARGRYPREEEFRLQVTVSVLRDFGRQLEATTRAIAIADTIDTVLRGDPTVGGVVREALIGGAFNATQHQDLDTGRLCEGRVTFEITCKTRL